MEIKHLDSGNVSHRQTKKPQTKHKLIQNKHNLVIIIAIFLLGLSLVVIGNFNSIQGFFSQNLIGLITGNAENNKQNTKPSYNFNKVKPVSPATLADAYKRRSHYKAIGQVAVPSLHINLNIYRGVGNDELNLGVGSMKPHQKFGQDNFCLAGHNMDDGKSYFSALYSTVTSGHKLVGRSVYLMDYYHVYYYKINKAYFIAVNRTDLLANTKQPVISLFTCDATGAGRLFVQGKLVKTQALNQSPKSVQQAFKEK